MTQALPTFIISGLTDPRHIAELHAIAAGTSSKLILAATPLSIERDEARSICLDMTAFVDIDGFVAACHDKATKGQLMLLRDHQLGFDEVVRVVNDLQSRCVVLYTAISYDMDPSWVNERLSELSSLVAVEFFALDLFCDVEDAWRFFMHDTASDEFGPDELRLMCERFPSVLSADVTTQNFAEIAVFPAARGVLLACDELEPRLPAERHTLPFSVIEMLLREALERS